VFNWCFVGMVSRVITDALLG